MVKENIESTTITDVLLAKCATMNLIKAIVVKKLKALPKAFIIWPEVADSVSICNGDTPE